MRAVLEYSFISISTATILCPLIFVICRSTAGLKQNMQADDLLSIYVCLQRS